MDTMDEKRKKVYKYMWMFYGGLIPSLIIPAFLVIGLPLIIYGGTKFFKAQKEINALYKDTFVKGPLQQNFENVTYNPEQGFDRETVRNFNLVRMSGVFSSEDYIRASYQGVNFEMMKIPMEIRQDGVVFADSELDENGKVHPIPGSEKLYPCTGVIVAVSQELGSSIMQSTRDIGTKPSGLLIADEDGHTSRPGVFAAGDAASGARTVVEAVANGKRVAEAMHAYMQSLPQPVLTDYPDVPVVSAVDAAAQAEQLI